MSRVKQLWRSCWWHISAIYLPNQVEWEEARKKGPFLDKKHVKMDIFLPQLYNNIRKKNWTVVLVPLLCYFGLGEIIAVIYICQSSIFLFHTADLRSDCTPRTSFALLLSLYTFLSLNIQLFLPVYIRNFTFILTELLLNSKLFSVPLLHILCKFNNLTL